MVILTVVLIMIIMPFDIYGDDSMPETAAHGSRVITGTELRQSGITRLSDILLFTEEWDVRTADGYRWQASAGLSGYQGQNWDVMVDGHLMDLNILGSQNINMLPVTTDLIDYVEVISEPGMHEGLYVDEGMLHIHTFEPETGGSFRLRYSVGNETGDPGLYKYTSESSPNIDKIGPDNSVSVSLRDDSFWVRLNYKYENHAATDPAIEGRSRYNSWQDRQVRTVMPSFQMETDALPGHHRLFAGGALNGAQTDIFTIPAKSFYRSDMLFLDQKADEIPVLSEYFHGGANGTIPAGSSTDWFYRATWLCQNIYSPSFRRTPDPSFASSKLSLNSHIRHQNGSAVFIAGSGFERLHAQTEYSLTERSLSTGTIYLSAELPLTGDIRQEIGMNMTCLDGKVALKDYGTTYWKINDKNDLAMSFSASQRLFGENNGRWFWRDRGYRFFDDEGGDIQVNGEFTASQIMTSRISWRYRPRKKIETTTALIYRSFDSLSLAKYKYSLDNSGKYFESSTLIDTDAGGQTYCIEFRGGHNQDGKFSQSMYIRYRPAVHGDNKFKDEQNTLPDYKMTYTAKLAMRHNLSIHGRITVISPTEWMDYREVSKESDGLYPCRLSRQVVTDISVEKWLNRRTIRTMLQLRNIFNHQVRYYPAGALFDMSVYLQLELLLDSLWRL